MLVRSKFAAQPTRARIVVEVLLIVGHMPEHKSFSRRVLPCCLSVARREHLAHPLGRAFPATNQHERAHHRAHHRMQERIPDDRDDDEVRIPDLLLLERDISNIAMRRLILRRNRHAKALEIMLAQQMRRSLFHCLDIERLAQMPAELLHEQRRGHIGTDVIAVFAHNGRKPCRKILRHRAH